MEQLAKIWLLGERFMMPKMQNQALGMLWETLACNEQSLSSAFIENIGNTLSTLRTLVVKYLAWTAPSWIFAKTLENSPKALALEVAMEMKLEVGEAREEAEGFENQMAPIEMYLVDEI